MPADARRTGAEDDPAEVLVHSGVIDVEFVSAQLGREIDSVEEAAAAVIDAGDISPHPLFEAGWLARKAAWQRAGSHPVSWYFADRRRRTRLSTHPLVEPRLICGVYPEARVDAYGALSYWLARATPDSVLPTRMLPHEVTWGDYRAAAIEAARVWRKAHHRRRVALQAPAEQVEAPTSATTDSPAVSIIVTCQDSGPRVRSTVAAIQAQSFEDWELVVVDRGSLDDTAGVLTGLSAFDARIKVVSAGRDTPGHAFNTALEVARGRHLAFAETGRAWSPGHLAALHAHALATSSPIVLSGNGPAARDRRELLAGRGVDLSAWLVRRDAIDAIGGFDTELGGAVERDAALRLTELFATTAIDSPLTRRGEHGAGTHGTGSHGDDWTSVVLERHLVDWDEAATLPHVPGRVSVVLPVGSEPRRTIEWLDALHRETVDKDLEVELIAVGVRLKRAAYVLSHALAQVVPLAQFVPSTADLNVSAATNLGIARATGETVVLVRPECMPPRTSLLTPLSQALDAEDVGVAQSITVNPNGTVQSAGAHFSTTHRAPGVLLQGHPVADAQRIGTTFAVAAPWGLLVAMRRATAVALRGLSSRFRGPCAEVDLGLRARAAGLGGSVAVSSALSVSVSDQVAGPAELIGALASLRASPGDPPESQVEAQLAAAGFEITDQRSRRVATHPTRPASPAVLLPEPVVRAIDGIHESPPRLRWAIDIAAPAAARGDRWGDTYFADSLADALRRHGQDVAVDRRDARHRDTRDHDDVLLVLRGLDRVFPRPGLLNLMWIISHPDLVAPTELAGYDAVYAASRSWAERSTHAWGVPIEPLLQCTDSRVFGPDRGAAGSGPEVLFIGNSRGVYRFAVRTALGAGLPLTLHGNDWNNFVPASLIASTVVANDKVGELYGSAEVVLNDHHLDMRRDSFASNRLFDAAACGARVATDAIEGLDEIFHGLVQPFTNERELAALCRPPYDAFPSTERRLEIARGIVADHSFDKRAETLVDGAVRRLLARRSHGAGN